MNKIAGIAVSEVLPKKRTGLSPILFIHGLWAGGWIWKDWLEYFAAKGHPSYALTLSGRDRPSPDLGKVPARQFVGEVVAVARQLDGPILVGHSSGALLAQKAAEECAPEAVVGLGPAAPRGIFALASWMLLRAALAHGHELLLQRQVLPSWAEFVTLDCNQLPVDRHEPLYRHFVPDSGRMLFDIAAAGVPVDAAKVRCPVLCVVGSDDRFTPPAVVRQVAKKYGADYREFDGHGHMIVVEPGWQEVAGDVAGWLERRAVRAADAATFA